MSFVQILRAFPSPPEGFPRTLRILLPSAFFEEQERTFPVLYMQDGQNIFDHPESAPAETWAADRAMDALVARGAIEPWIVVGIDHGVGRMEDYSPWDEPRARVRGRAHVYASFVVDHLKPFIEQSYRGRPEREWTAVAGSSLGGLASLYLGWKHPEVFGRIGAFSPSVMWSNRAMFRTWRAHGPLPARIYLDAGAEELFETDDLTLDYGEAVRAFAAHLRSLGYRDDELRVVLEPEGQHSEVDWRRRLPSALAWLLR